MKNTFYKKIFFFVSLFFFLFLRSFCQGFETKDLTKSDQIKFFQLLKGKYEDLNSCFVTYPIISGKSIHTNHAKVYYKFQGSDKFSFLLPILTNSNFVLKMSSVYCAISKDNYYYFGISLEDVSSEKGKFGKITGDLYIFYMKQNNKLDLKFDLRGTFNSCYPMSRFKISINNESKQIIEDLLKNYY